jgi:hypothetical protein
MKSKYICNTGGALGSDITWEHHCIKAGIHVRSYSFTGHSSQSSRQSKIILNEQELISAQPYVVKAAKNLRRNLPKTNYVLNLLRRNWYQVKDADTVYAIGTIDENKQVEGGTGYAVQMSVDNLVNSLTPISLNVFDQNVGSWFTWKHKQWFQVDEPELPTKIFAGIGTRNVNPKGFTAINDIIVRLKEAESI